MNTETVTEVMGDVALLKARYGVIPSRYQLDIFNFMEYGEGNGIFKARAGTGKTWTIVNGLSVLPVTWKVQFLAFGKDIAKELKSQQEAGKIRKDVEISTFHSKGMGAWLRYVGRGLKVGQTSHEKTRNLLWENLPENELEMYGSFVCQLVSLAKNEGMGYLVPNTVESWQNIINHYDLSLDSEEATEERAIKIAMGVLEDSVSQKNYIDFDDMLYMPLINNLSFTQNDAVVIDEGQDTNRVQQALLKRMLKPDGRLFCVGDDKQAIYAFRGADSEAMNRIKTEFNCKELPLSICYRCSKQVIKKAQQYVPDIESAPNAIEGSVINMIAYDKDTFKPTDAIICRNCAPIIEFAYSLIGKGIGCRVYGRKIGEGLIKLIEKMKAADIKTLEEKLDKWAAREIAKWQSKGNESAAEGVQDKLNCIQLVISHLNEDKRTVNDLINEIKGLFDDKINGLLTLMTAHKSKGLEFKRVFILDMSKYMPSKWARTKHAQEQEMNLIYVAITRAKEDLVFINSDCWKK